MFLYICIISVCLCLSIFLFVRIYLYLRRCPCILYLHVYVYHMYRFIYTYTCIYTYMRCISITFGRRQITTRNCDTRFIAALSISSKAINPAALKATSVDISRHGCREKASSPTRFGSAWHSARTCQGGNHPFSDLELSRTGRVRALVFEVVLESSLKRLFHL